MVIRIARNGKTIEEGEVLCNHLNTRFRNNRNWLCAIVGPTGCFFSDTKLYGQTQSVDELYKSGKNFIDTISITKAKKGMGAYYPIHSKSEIIPSGMKELYEIELEDGTKVLASKDHRFFIQKCGRKEKTVAQLKVGDAMVCYPENYIEDYFNKANNYTKKRVRSKFKHQRICTRCGNLYYINCEMGKTSSRKCNQCRLKMRRKSINKMKSAQYPIWFEWENNLLRILYPSSPKEQLLNLMPNRNWNAIIHQAIRLKISRDKKFKNVNNWTSNNNPMKDPEIKQKTMDKIQKYIFRRNHKTDIEKKVADFLDAEGIQYLWNSYVKTSKAHRFPDFRIGKLIIECDGSYWHQDKEHDKNRQTELEELGYKVIRFDDKQINRKFEEVKKCILKGLSL